MADIPVARLRFEMEGASGPLTVTDAVRLVGRHFTCGRFRMLSDTTPIVAMPDENDSIAAHAFVTGDRPFPQASLAPGESLVTLSGLESEPQVRAWAMEYRFPALSDGVALTWSIAAGVDEIRSGLFLVVLQLRYESARPLPVVPDAPFSARGLLSDGSVRVSLDGEQLRSKVTTIGHRLSVLNFVRLLERPERRWLTNILVSRERCLSLPRILDAVAGLANVYISSSDSIERSVRGVLFAPVSVADPAFLFHPGRGVGGVSVATATAERYEPPVGSVDIENEVIRSVRFARSWPKVEDVSVDSLAVLRNRIQHERLGYALKNNVDDEELIDLYVAEVATIRARLKAANELAEESQLSADDAAMRVEALNQEKGRLLYERQQLIVALDDARAATPRSCVLDSIPASLVEVLDLAGRYFERELTITEQARQSAKRCSFRNLTTAWRCLVAMAQDLHVMHFRDSLNAKLLEDAFHSSTGFELATWESESTRNNARLRSLRTVELNGVYRDITPHVKVGKVKANCLRAHYFADFAEKRIVIGHFGNHLETSTKI